jgi:HlyD family secretion protein
MMRARRLILILVIVVAVGLGALALARRNQAHPAPAAGKTEQLVVTTTVKRQDLLITVTQTGAVAAKNATSVIPEISGRIQWLCENGIVVAPGDAVLKLDPKQLEDALQDLQIRLGDATRRSEQAKVTGAARMKEVQLRLQRAQADVASFERQQKETIAEAEKTYEFHKQELEKTRQDAEVKSRLADKGLISGTEVERANASVKAAEFALEQEQTALELKRTQADTEIGDKRRTVMNTMRDSTRTRSWSERESRMTGNEVENLTLQVERAKADLEKTTITAPVKGLVVQATQGWMGESRLPRLGDFVSQGREFTQIIGLEKMLVKLELDQTQITGVHMGQPAEVSIEALPDKTLEGKIIAIGQTARRPPVQGWMGVSTTATFPVTLELPPVGKLLIRPGMRANVRFIARRIPNVLCVPSGCIFRRDNQTIAYVERDGKFVRTPVTTGASNGEYTMIISGLRENDRIALNDLASKISTPAASGKTAGPTKERRP